MKNIHAGIILTLFLFISATSIAAKFEDGPVIKGYGKHTPIQQDLVLDKNSHFKVAFDISKQGGLDDVNSSFNTLARFLNMHVANGIALENINLAMVVHGSAGFDLFTNEAFQEKYQVDNPNKELLTLLLKNNVKIYICGQSAVYHGIKKSDLITGVQMSLSALTAHAILQNQGYSLNPF